MGKSMEFDPREIESLLRRPVEELSEGQREKLAAYYRRKPPRGWRAHLKAGQEVDYLGTTATVSSVSEDRVVLVRKGFVPKKKPVVEEEAGWTMSGEAYQKFDVWPGSFGAHPGSITAQKIAVLEDYVLVIAGHERALDVGANHGALSFWLAGLGYTVDAYEPDPQHFARLSANVGVWGWPPNDRDAGVLVHNRGPDSRYQVILSLSVAHHQWRQMRHYGELPIDSYMALARWYRDRALPGCRLCLELPLPGDPVLEKVVALITLGFRETASRRTFSDTRCLYVLDLP